MAQRKHLIDSNLEYYQVLYILLDQGFLTLAAHGNWVGGEISEFLMPGSHPQKLILRAWGRA